MIASDRLSVSFPGKRTYRADAVDDEVRFVSAVGTVRVERSDPDSTLPCPLGSHHVVIERVADVFAPQGGIASTPGARSNGSRSGLTAVSVPVRTTASKRSDRPFASSFSRWTGAKPFVMRVVRYRPVARATDSRAPGSGETPAGSRWSVKTSATDTPTSGFRQRSSANVRKHRMRSVSMSSTSSANASRRVPYSAGVKNGSTPTTSNEAANTSAVERS